MTEFDRISEKIGFGDLKVKDRMLSIPRQGIYYYLWSELHSYSDIGKQAHRNHSSIIWGVKRFAEFLRVKNPKAIEIWEKINE